MGLGFVLSFDRVDRDGVKLSELNVDSGGGVNTTCEHFSSAGDDSHPMPDDYVVFVDIQRSGGSAVVGYIDTKNEGKARAGEKRFYARDSNGASVVEIWLKNDGSAILSNANGLLQLNANGDIRIQGKNISISAESVVISGATDINGASISTGGEIRTSGGVDLGTHTHRQPNDSFGNVEQETLPPS